MGLMRSLYMRSISIRLWKYLLRSTGRCSPERCTHIQAPYHSMLVVPVHQPEDGVQLRTTL